MLSFNQVVEKMKKSIYCLIYVKILIDKLAHFKEKQSMSQILSIYAKEKLVLETWVIGIRKKRVNH